MTDLLDRLKDALADRYAIEREIGSGGMATVYLAHDLRHDRQVAVKVLRPDLAATLGPVRFLREIKIAAQLQHPNILPLLDSGEAAGFLYYVMPYVEGQSLRDKLAKEGELPVGDAVRILRDVVDALTAAHAHGVVHRDIKPENVLLSGRHALVTDFGVAKAVSEATGRQQLTTAGVAVGTPAYMAPEQAAADPHLDHRVDIYAVGAVAYELLTGRPVFMGTTPQQVLSAHVTEAPQPVTKHRDTVPPALESVVMRCLEKKPADRYQTAEELLPQLEALATPSGGITPTGMMPVATVARRRWMTLGAAVGVAAVIAVMVILAAVPRGGAVRLDPNHVVVAVFRNETGNPLFDQLGKRAGQWITQGIQRGAIPIAPWDLAQQSWEYVSAEAGAGRIRDPVRALAEETGAGVVVSGAIYEDGDSLEIQVNVTDAVERRPLVAPNAVRGSREAQGALVERLARHVLGALAVGFDDRLAGVADVMGNAPSLEAYQAFDAGMGLYYGNEWADAVQQFLRAAELDSTFLTALVYAAFAAGNDASMARVSDSVRTALYARRHELSPYDARLVEGLRAAGQGDNQGYIAALRQAVEIAPGSKAAYNLARQLTRANRPREAIELLTTQLEPERGAMRGWWSYWTELARAYLMVGEHERALESSQQGRVLYPDDTVMLFWQGTALAALGRVDEIEALLDTCTTMNEGYRGPAGSVMSDIALSLAAFGHEEAAQSAAERAIRWYEVEYDSLLVQRWDWATSAAFLVAGRLEELRQYIEEGLREDPADVDLRASLGIVAAKLGDRETASEVADWIATLEALPPRVRSFWRGLIAEGLGNRDEAVALLSEFFTNAGFEYSYVYVPSLRGYAPFEELMRPKG